MQDGVPSQRTGWGEPAGARSAARTPTFRCWELSVSAPALKNEQESFPARSH
jgi:hypothetical protein